MEYEDTKHYAALQSLISLRIILTALSIDMNRASWAQVMDFVAIKYLKE